MLQSRFPTGKIKLTIENKSCTVASVRLCFIISIQKNGITAPTLSGEPGYNGVSKVSGTNSLHTESISISSNISASLPSKSSTTSFGSSFGNDSLTSVRI